MGYFSNGCEGDSYESKYCDHCINQDGPDDKSGCHIWLAHLLYNYGQDEKTQEILDLFIPRSKNGLGNEKCTMFRRGKTDREEVMRDEQLKFKYEEHMKKQKATPTPPPTTKEAKE